MEWRPDRLLKTILVWTAITMIVIWLPLVRGLMDGSSYAWALSPDIGGRGTEGDYWVVVLAAIFAVGLLYLGWRGARQPFHWLLLGWHLLLAGGAVAFALTSPESFRFRGDTMGIEFSLAWAGPLLFGSIALFSVIWVVRDLRMCRRRTAPPWNRMNRALLAAVVAMIPVQWVLLRWSGEAQSTTDQVGVILTLLQWVLLNLAFVPWQTKVPAEHHAQGRVT